MDCRSHFAPWSLILAALAIASVATARLPQAKPPGKARRTASPQPPVDPVVEAVRLNNLGVAYMNQQRFEQALKLFEQASAKNPQLSAARLNQGIALVNLQRTDPARAILLEVSQREPENPRARYNLGLLYKNAGEAEKALAAFTQVAQLDPDDADTHYFLGLMHNQLQQYDHAVAAFERALALNPFHVSAEFGLARALQRKGDSAKAREHLARFQKLTLEKLGAPMSLAYGDQGPYSLAAQVTPAPGAAPAAIPVRFVSVPAAQSGLKFIHVRGKGVGSHPGSGGCLFDYNGDGQSDLFLLNGPNQQGVLYQNIRGRFVETTAAAQLDASGDGLSCTAGDYDNDGLTDLAVGLVGRMALYRNLGKGVFKEVTGAAGIRTQGETLAIALLDFDHDGDLDLYVSTLANKAESFLWRNNGNGTFVDWTTQTGLTDLQNLSAAVTDINNDRAIDFVLTGPAETPSILLNPREGKFRRERAFPPSIKPNSAGVAVFDFDRDGWMDLAFTHLGGELTLWRNGEGKKFEPVNLPSRGWRSAFGIATLDFDNDGWVDIVAVGQAENGGQIRVLRNRGSEGFEDTTVKLGLQALELDQPTTLLTADYDSDGDSDLFITHKHGVVLLRNDGGNKNNWLRISLKGLNDNKSAIGTKVEVFAGALYQKFEVQSSSGYLGQSASDILVGLGSAKEAEVVRLLWPTGVLQDEVQLAARRSHIITEIDRRGSSCPILFVWTGSRYEFIADAIGPGIVGHWVAPGVRNVSDPTEYLKVEGARVQPRNGWLSFRFAEPMEEIVYLDQVRLLAVDHPGEVEVYPNERFFASGPPFPEFKVIASRDARPPRGAWDHRGRDVLPELLERDRRYVTGFAEAPYKGFAEIHWVELDLGEGNRVRRAAPLRLLLRGFTDYFTATSVYAAHQAGVKAIVPYVEALDAQGRWVRVVEDMGFPAGLARTMVADLTGRLPAGTRRIRIVTNLKIYWDQVLVDTTPDGVPWRLTEVPLATATLAFRGYPREIRGNPPGDIRYVHEEVSLTGPYARPAGNYTRYGDVRALLKAAEDRFVILGSGDEVALDFDPAGLPPLPAGWRRDYFFYADGFAKDMDFYAAHAYTVEPLPFHAMGRYPYAPLKSYPQDEPYLTYLLEDNAREISGRPAASFRFRYGPEKKK